jgi:cation diffusion facilitator CzcD-associated flavoprotein CzcO
VLIEHFDVVVVGAGISGIGAAYFLQRDSPHRSFVVLEARDDIGGTWDLFRYPGVRSDSDMHTLGYSFKPWTHEKAIADAPAIMEYLRETVAEHDIARHVRFGTRVASAEWSSSTSMWTLRGIRVSTGEEITLTCNFLFMCSGYYSYRHGHQPDFPGHETFEGRIVHPQQWPEDLDYTGKRVVVIGSGATAVTLVPALAKTAMHVTMLQRSPTWVASASDVDKLANRLRRVLPPMLAYRVTRRKNIEMQQQVYRQTRVRPEKVKAYLLGKIREELGPDFDVEKHFTPTYNPWDQRLCLVPNSDLFVAIKEGKASVTTDAIERFDSAGIVLASGEHLDADIIVTATGLELVTLGEMEFVVDGAPVDFAKTWTYKGMAYSGVPNLVSSFGYVNASWTLRSDLTCQYVCRLLNHMSETGTTRCTPTLRDADTGMPERPWIDEFTPNYMKRVMHRFPRQGDREPWVNPQNYKADRKMFLENPVNDGVMICD